jgi:hypothetical protein
MIFNYFNFLFYLLIIIFISFSKIKYRKITSLDNILFIISTVIVSCYDKTGGILFFILYILYLTNVEDKLVVNDFIESFSVKKQGFHDLNNVLKFLKTPKSKKVLETMFTKK